jgi:hypothetical protein
VLARYPTLAKLNWEWNTENWSMGHGNYLMSEFCGQEKHGAYDGRDTVSTRYEIRMNAYDREMYAYRDYPGVGAPEPAAQPGTVTQVEIRRNEQLNGIEVVFPAKPSQSILDSLKELGFRWSRFNNLWYAKYTEALYEQVTNLLREL